jgi:hypothetical protein
VSFPLQLSSCTRKSLYRRLQLTYVSDSLTLIKRSHELLALAQCKSASYVAVMLSVGEHTVRADRNQSLF